MNDSKVILGIDIGYSACKVCILNEFGDIIHLFKFPSSIGITKILDGLQMDNIYEYDGHHYMVGDDTKHLPSENIVNLEEYKNLEYYAPLLLEHACRLAKVKKVDIVVSGLSIAQLQNSGYFQNALSEFNINNEERNFTVYLLPQGAGSKLTYQKYQKIPELRKEYLGEATYCIVDIGFNTLDFVLVNKGKTDSNLFVGIEKSGCMKIATQVAKLIHEKHNRSISLSEANDILESGIYKLRGQRYDYSEDITKLKEAFLKEVLTLVNEKYSGILDKLEFMVILGGGSYIFKSSSDGFIRVVHDQSEFYNAVGEALFGLQQLK